MRKLLLLLLLVAPAFAQPLEVLKDQAGLFPVTARLLEPARVGPARVEIEIGEPIKATQTVNPKLSTELVLDMPSMPRMKAITATFKPLGPRKFEGRFEFPMKGIWRLHFVILTPHGNFRFISRIPVGGATMPGPLPVSENCGPDGTPGTLEVQLPDGRLHIGPNRLRLKLPGQPQQVSVAVDMPAMPMAIPPKATTRQADGTYEAEVTLPMTGVWHVRADADGTVLGPVSVVVPDLAPRRPSRLLLLLLLPVLLACVVWRRSWLAPAALVLAALAAGAFIERYWPPDPAQGMAMDMLAPDMGMGQMVAPVPVLEAMVARLPMTVAEIYPGRVEPIRESILRSDASPGTRLKQGVVMRTLSPGTVAVAEDRTVDVVFSLPMAQARKVLPGKTKIEVLSGMEVVTGKLTRLSALSENGEVRATARLNNVMVSKGMGSASEATLLALGEEVKVRCALLELPLALSVPLEAIRENNGKPALYVLEDIAGLRVARLRPVTLGAANDTHIVVSSGIQEGQKVVVAAEAALHDGSVVTLASWGNGAYRNLLIPGLVDGDSH